MSHNIGPTSEKLYLCRGKNESEDIFVESTLHQHHINGIRFIYKQFKRKKPGIIMNNPLGYGNSLQVTLFLGAIQRLLKKPILILCEDGEEYEWLELFQKHTQCNDVVVNPPNAFVKKSIFIKNMDGAETFTRRPWSVLVVDNESFFKMKTAYNKFETDYKIWITPTDMKKQLDIFSLIYKWIYPKEKFNAEDFKAKSGDRKDIITKCITLATFFEDIVFRTKLLTPFENTFERQVKTQRRVTEKNKDSTGTKIKRSKRTAEASNSESTNHTNPDISATKIPKLNNIEPLLDKTNISDSNLSNNKSDTRTCELMDIEEKHSDLDVETYISSKEPVTKQVHDFDNIFNNSQDSKLVLHYESDTSETEVVNHNSLENTTKPNNPCSNEVNSSKDITMSPESEDNAYELETQEFLDDNNMKINDNDYKHINVNEDEDPIIETTCSVVETKSFDAENVFDSNSEKSNGIDKTPETLNTSVEENRIVPSKKDNREENMVTEESQNINNKTVDIDSKITEHEDRIFKKFKGTFLDSIF